MAFRPASNLKSRTFIGLLIAQFLAAFNDQAIHASAMFFAFHMRLLNEKEAISLMPILFYAPWAIFCTLAGYFADRYSKRHSLVFWKVAEIAICLVAVLGFYLGDVHDMKLGPILVLGCVFLMGMHSAFFVPAKYGVMPEILEPQLLSRGNGILESLSFLAVILGTVCGGMLSSKLHGHETWIGVVFLVLAIVGAVASLMIETMPAANPGRKFPPYLYGPLKDSLKSLLSARPLALAVVGIAFFTFVVAYMRQAVYMLGESQVPRWDEFKTSLVVGSTALGIGAGSPLAGWLSGRKVELGLVPLGGVGMVLAAALAAASVHWVPGLVVCIVVIGFFTGFYLVPLYTLLQHRAPKASKGDAVAVSNFINVTGAILASILFFVLVSAFQKAGLARPIPFGEPQFGLLTAVYAEEGRVKTFKIENIPELKPAQLAPVLWTTDRFPTKVDPDEPVRVRIAECEYRNRLHILLCRDDENAPVIFDNSGLPAFLFLGAAGITVFILLALWIVQPDLAQRAAWAFRNLGRARVRAIGTHHVPLRGPAILASNCETDSQCRHLRSATDRLLVFVGPVEKAPALPVEQMLREVQLGFDKQRIVVLTEGAINLLPSVKVECPIIPTFVGHVGGDTASGKPADLRVAFGAPVVNHDPVAVTDAIRETAVAEDDYHGH